TINSLRFNANNGVTLSTGGNLTIATGGILETANVGGNAVNINNNTLLSGNGKDLIVIQNDTAGTMTINAAIGAAGQGLTKAGPGKLIVTGTNPFDQGLFVDGGTLEYNADGQLGAAGKAITLNGGAIRFTGTVANGYTNTRVITINA